MFDSLSDRIKQDEDLGRKEVLLRWTAVILLSILLFGGLYYGVRMLG